MSAARIREAAKVLRDAAEAATPGPWVQKTHRRFGLQSTLQTPDGDMNLSAYTSPYRGGECATYIALMSPPVALALADWLDAEAHHQDRWQKAFSEVTEPVWMFQGDTLNEALTLADTILGDRA